MPLGEAVIYLKRAVRRSFGPSHKVRFLDARSREAKEHWKKEGPLPLVLIDGDIVFKGSFSAQQIVQELRRRSQL
jgi:disulfide oxidoreductase YuzD